MGSRRVRTMEEFAALSGISRPTVSKYFQDPGSVRASTRARIEAALEAHDYRPNIYAINQNRRLTKNVGIVVPFLADPFFAEIARAIERRVFEAGFAPTLFSAYGDPAREVEVLDALRSMRPAGVLLAPLGRASDRGAVERFCRDVPTILFDSNMEGVGQAFVGSDNRSFVAQTVEYLCRTGPPPVFFEMETPANPNARKRRAAFEAEMAARGHAARVVSVPGAGWGFEEIGRQGALAVLGEDVAPGESVLCSNDRLAIGLLSACWERGLRVGRGAGSALRVASHDDHPFARFTCPALTTAAHGYDEVAGTAVERLLSLIEAGGRFERREETLIPARLVLRDSA